MRRLVALFAMASLVTLLAMTAWADDNDYALTEESILVTSTEESEVPENSSAPSTDGEAPEDEIIIVEPTETGSPTDSTDPEEEPPTPTEGEEPAEAESPMEEKDDPLEALLAAIPSTLPDEWAAATLAVASSQIGVDAAPLVLWTAADYSPSTALIYFSTYYAGVEGITTYSTAGEWCATE